MSAAQTTEAILLRRSRFGETGQLLVWLAPEFGKVRTAARGSTKKSGGLQSPVDLFFLSEIQFAASKRSDLHALREVRVLESWSGLQGSYARLLAASYFAELCDLLSEPGHASPGLFSLLRRALGHISTSDPSRRAVEFFESEACRVLGFGHGGNAIGAIEMHAGRVPINRRRLMQMLS